MSNIQEFVIKAGYKFIYNFDNHKCYIFSDKSNASLSIYKNFAGYLCTKIGRKQYYLHRLVAIYLIPNPNDYECVDHINGDKSDCKIDNLHWVNKRQNSQNMRNAKGYYFNEKSKKYQAQIKLEKVVYLGSFDTEEEAHNAYCVARLQRNLESGATVVGY